MGSVRLITVCRHCGRGFDPRHSKGARGPFCSSGCLVLAGMGVKPSRMRAGIAPAAVASSASMMATGELAGAAAG